jgi:hypothetical protein
MPLLFHVFFFRLSGFCLPIQALWALPYADVLFFWLIQLLYPRKLEEILHAFIEKQELIDTQNAQTIIDLKDNTLANSQSQQNPKGQ